MFLPAITLKWKMFASGRLFGLYRVLPLSQIKQWMVKVRWRTRSHTPDGGLASTAVIEPKLITFSPLIMSNRSSVIEMDILCSGRTTLSKLT